MNENCRWCGGRGYTDVPVPTENEHLRPAPAPPLQPRVAESSNPPEAGLTIDRPTIPDASRIPSIEQNPRWKRILRHLLRVACAVAFNYFLRRVRC